MRILDSDGSTQLLVLGDTDMVGGYLVLSQDPGVREFEETAVKSYFVDDEFPIQYRLTGRRQALTLLVEGSDVPELNARLAALLAAVERPMWFLEDSSTTWRCWPANSAFPHPADMAQPWREGTLTFRSAQQVAF